MINATPVVKNEFVSTESGSSVTVNVLSNDIDPDGSILVLANASVVSGLGAVLINTDQTLSFTPNQGYVGDAKIAYTVMDRQRLKAY